jgi:hypothetical protein
LLLDEIIDLATDNKQSITVLLRKCLVLATRLKNERLKVWANQELNGYGDDEPIPEYRMMYAQAKGQFLTKSGFWGGQHYVRDLPSVTMEKAHRWATETIRLGQSISVYEEIISGSSSASGVLHYPWNNDMVLFYQEKFIDGSVLLSAWQELPTMSIAGLVEKVRTRVLNMALELKPEIAQADDLEQMTSEEAKKVDQTIVNNIFRGNVYFSTGQSSMSVTAIQEQQNIIVGDWSHLERALTGSGIEESDLKNLSTAMQSDGDGKLSEGGSVMKWIKENAPKVLVGGVKMGAEVGKSVLTEFLLRYYGLKP